MSQIVDAVFEQGVFRPLGSPAVPIVEGQHVRLTVDTVDVRPAELLEAAAQVYAGLSEREIDEIEHIALDRRDFFRDGRA
jgi:predicted DNA-binding antitoxin AbrB/MazE fold protein